MTNASVPVVDIEVSMNFSKHTAIIRSHLKNSGAHARHSVTDVTLKLQDINNTVGAAYLRTLCEWYGNSRI